MFASSAEILARTDSNAAACRAVELSLMLTRAELQSASALIDSVNLDDEASDDAGGPRPSLYIPRLQRSELRRRSDLHELPLDELLAEMSVGEPVRLARRLVELFVAVNEASRVTGHQPLFKMTDRICLVVAELPWMAAVSAQSFGDLVDALYFLLYESPGSGSLRYLAKHGGPFDDDDCEIAFVIKRLRNHLRHDPEHGSPADVRRKFEKLQVDMQSFGFVDLPRTRADYGRLQAALLREAVEFLELLLSSIASGSAAP
jgi:hypothetical protein